MNQITHTLVKARFKKRIGLKNNKIKIELIKRPG